jgi:hypothetical protein
MGSERALAADCLAHDAFIEARRLDDEGKPAASRIRARDLLPRRESKAAARLA